MRSRLALYAGGDYDNISTDPNLFYVYAGVMPGKKTEEVERALYAEIDKLKSEPVADEEIQKAKNQIEASFIMGQDSIFYQAMLLGQFETVADWKLLEKYVDSIRAVTQGRRDAGGKGVFQRGQQDGGNSDSIERKELGEREKVERGRKRNKDFFEYYSPFPPSPHFS